MFIKSWYAIKPNKLTKLDNVVLDLTQQNFERV